MLLIRLLHPSVSWLNQLENKPVILAHCSLNQEPTVINMLLTLVDIQPQTSPTLLVIQESTAVRISISRLNTELNQVEMLFHSQDTH